MTRPGRAAARHLAALLAAALACSCGGGGGDGGNGGGNNPPPPPTFAVQTSTLADAVVGVPYNQTVRVTGGTGSLSFSVSDGELPDGLALDAGSGVISGSPNGPVGSTDFTVTVEDSSSPPQDASRALSIDVNATSQGRNDSIATATPIGNGVFAASISPSGNPSSVLDADEDYYAITTTADSTVTVDIDAQALGSPLDSVIEIVDGNGNVLNACTPPLYNSSCVSDDGDPGVELDSFLEIRVAGPATFYLHVVDWGSNARPDMLYELAVSGVN